MGYVANNLSKNEKIIYEGKIHWFIFVPWILLLSIVLMTYPEGNNEVDEITMMSINFFLIASIIGIVHSFFYKISTEFAITNRRIISKTGFISRKTVEFNHNKIESINVEQGILGRIFNYGSVVINGTGGVKTPVKNIAKPLKFRIEAMDVIDVEKDSSISDR
ncbi:MAG: PH domain-containing protein [Burkholderiales bacterium]|nr:PH domain-containing protein [Burkholderiales bacterium]